MRVLVVNAGSSSLKLDVLDDDRVVGSRRLDAPRAGVNGDDVGAAVAGLGPFEAVGHRIVHGGDRFRGPVRIDEKVRSALEQLGSLAPLHQRKSLDALDAVFAVCPGTPAVACFDTAFHATLPEAARTYALPEAWRARWAIRRYGFHGLSCAWASRRAAEMLGVGPAGLRTVICHLGAGASVTAVDGGRSVDTTMGFTPLEGLPMATRSGTIDPGLVLWLLQRTELTAERVEHALEHESGLWALAGTADMREVVAGVAAQEPASVLAFDVYLRGLRAAIAAMAAAMGGLDVLVFTGGVGEHATVVREAAADGLGFLGIGVDKAANEQDGPADRSIGNPDARVRTLVIASREDREIARQTRELPA